MRAISYYFFIFILHQLATGEIAYLPFLSLSDKATNVTDPNQSTVIHLPSPLSIGNTTADTAYVYKHGIITFGSTLDLSSATNNLYSTYLPNSINLLAVYWNHFVGGTLQYEVLNNTESLHLVDQFLAANQSYPSFSANWSLVVQWNNVCPFSISSQSCTETNSFQAVISTNGVLTVAIYTYKCGYINGMRTVPIIGYRVSGSYWEQHTWTNTIDILQVDCLNEPVTMWSNFMYFISEARPTVQLISSDELIIYNDSVSVNLSCRIIGNPLPEVAWFKDNQVINSSTNFSITSETVNDVTVVSTMTILDVSQRNFGQYYCHGSNKLDGYGSQVATVIDYKPVAFRFPPFSATIRLGNAKKFNCLVSGRPRPTINWIDKFGNIMFNSRDVEITHNEITNFGVHGQLTIYNVSYDANGTYSCQASNIINSNGATNVIERYFNIIVEGIPKFVLLSETPLVANISQSFQIVFKAFPKLLPEVVDWFFNSQLLTCGTPKCSLSEDKLVLTLHHVAIEDEGVYTVRAANGYGTSTIQVFLLVQSPPDILSHSADMISLEGSHVTLTCRSYGYPSPNISWSTNGTPLNEYSTILSTTQVSIGLYVVVSVLNLTSIHSAGIYTCTASVYNLIDVVNITLNIQSMPEIILNPLANTTIELAGNNLTLHCNASGYPLPTMQWYKDDVPLHPDQFTRGVITYDTVGDHLVRSTLNIKGLIVLDQGIYQCEANTTTSLSTLMKTEMRHVIVYDPPVILSKSKFVIVNESTDSIMFSCTVVGYPIPIISWSRTTTAIGGSEIIDAGPKNDSRLFVHVKIPLKLGNGSFLMTSELTVQNVTNDDEGMYTCNAVNYITNNTKNVSITYNLTVQTVPVLTADQLTVTGLRGQNVSIQIFIERDDPRVIPADIVWFLPGKTRAHDNSKRHSISPDRRTLTVLNAQFNDSGNYTAVASNVAGESSLTINVDIQGIPVITNDILSQNILAKFNASFTCNTVSRPPLIYADWYYISSNENGTKLLQSSVDKYVISSTLYSTTLLVLNAQFSDVGKYICVVGNVHGNASTNGHLSVQVPTEIVQGPRNMTVMFGESISLSCIVVGHPSPNVTFWKISDNGMHHLLSAIIGINSYPTPVKYYHNIDSVMLSDTGSYYCTAVNYLVVNSKSISSHATLKVILPPNITYISPDVEIIAGGSAIFECVFEAVPDPLVVWRFNDVLLADIGSDKYSFDHGNYTLTVHDVQVYDAGEYTCTVSNMYGNDTEIFHLYVQVKPIIIFPTNFSTQSVAAGDTVVLLCISSGNPLPTISWYFNNELLPNNMATTNISVTESSEVSMVTSTLRLVSVKETDRGNYTCSSSNDLVKHFGVLSSEVLLNILFPPSVTTTNSSTVISNELMSVELACNVSGNPLPEVKWYKDNALLDDSVYIINQRYQYTGLGEVILSTVFLRNVTGSFGGLYKCEGVNNVTNLINSTESRSFSITIIVPPHFISSDKTINITLVDEIPQNFTIKFNYTGGSPYINLTWAFISSADSNTSFAIIPTDHYRIYHSLEHKYIQLDILGIKYSDKGTYTALISNLAGSSRASVHVDINVAADVISVGPLQRTVNESTTVSFTCIADGIPPPSKIYWFRNKTSIDTRFLRRVSIVETQGPGFRSNVTQNIRGLNSTLIISDPLYSVDNGEYSCRATNQYGVPAVLKDSFILTIVQPPMQDFCLSQPCKNGATCNSIERSCLCVDGFAGVYCDKAVNVRMAPMIVDPPQNLTGDLYSRVTLSCTVTGNPQPRVTWYKDGQVVKDQDFNEYTFTIQELGLEDRGFYHCRAANVIDGVVQYASSYPAVVNIKGVPKSLLQNVSVSATSPLQEFVNNVNEIITGRILSGNTELFYIELQANSIYNATTETVPVIVTVITQERASHELLNFVRSRLRTVEYIDFLIDEFDRFDGCVSEAFTIPSQSGNPNLNVTIVWHETNIGSNATVQCPCAGVDLGGGELYAYRYCGGDFINGSRWSKGIVEACNFTDRAREICKLASLPPTKRVQELANIVDDIDNFEPTEVSIVASILISAEDGVTGDKNASDNAYSVIDSISNLSPNLLLQTKQASNAPTRLLNTLQIITNNLPFSRGSDRVVSEKQSFVAENRKFNASTYQGLRFSRGNNTQNLSASITLPGELLKELKMFDGVPYFDDFQVSSIYYKNPSLFIDDSDQKVSTPVISATVNTNGSEILVKDLDYPVRILLDKVQLEEGMANATCVYWNVSLSQWDQNGCRVVNETNSTVTCECDHLTNFAAILDISPNPESNLDTDIGKALTAISYIGIIVSIVCLLITVFTYLYSKKLRRSDHGRLLLNLCFAMLGVYMSYILALHTTSVEAICAIVSLLLQYFLLVTFFAMAAEALNLYIKLVVVLGRGIGRYVLKAIIVSWCSPILIVLFCFAPDYKNYIASDFCRAYGIPFYLGTIVPFGLIYIFNWVMFILIMINLLKKHCTKKFSESHTEETKVSLTQQFMIALTMSILFGLGWGVALPVGILYNVPAARDTFAILFILLTGFQGAFIFFMHCVRSQEVRKEWKRLFYRVTCRKQKATDSSFYSSVSRRPRKTNTNTSISYVSESTADYKKREEWSPPRSSDSPPPIDETTVRLELDIVLKDTAYPLPSIDLNKARELFPSNTSFASSSGACKSYDNPIEKSLDEVIVATPVSVHSTPCFNFDNPFMSTEISQNGIIHGTEEDSL